jgi:hypothetical protein
MCGERRIIGHVCSGKTLGLIRMKISKLSCMVRCYVRHPSIQKSSPLWAVSINTTRSVVLNGVSL